MKTPHICCIHIYRRICYRQKTVQYKGNYYNSFWLTKYFYFLFFRQFLKIIPQCSHTIPMFQLYFSKSCIFFFRCPHIFTGTLAYVQSIGLVTNIWANTVHTLMITSGFKTWKWHWLHNVVPRTTGLPKAAFILYIKPSTSPCVIWNWPRPFQVSLYVSMCHFQHSCYVTTASSKSYSHQLYVCRE